MHWIWFQLLGFVGMIALFKYVESRSAMRGAKGVPLENWAYRLLRICFLFLLTAPLLYFFPLSIIAILLYLPQYLSLAELNGGRPSPWVRQWRLWNWAQKYFQLQLIKTVDLDPRRQYLFGLHPHGILTFGGVINMATDVSKWNEKFPGIERFGLVASCCFYIPLYRELLLGGGIVDASKFNADKMIKMGKSLFLVPGGATESLYSVPDEDRLVLRKRLGFVKLALRNGTPLVPCFSFGETDAYSQLFTSSRWITYLKTKFQSIFGIALPLITNIIPRKVNITTVVGAPIEVPKIEDPNDETAQRYLDLYINCLTDLYNKHKLTYNRDPNKQLIIM
eukprot:TRINITY_DN9158_c0_g1_i1.p1 TRINITY_DN9158_c0_g1~~TRINITY_DN9158_c0_g1_i1.p1  ORF type:complete len:336 (-),score=43.47 TRINITY_DN9158_c0_g1_i1:30-1037(-)